MRNSTWRCTGFGMVAAMFLGSAMPVEAQQPAKTIKIGIVTFLSGPAAGPFGVPARNAAELLIEALNAGSLPAPYNKMGINGMPIETIIVDEAGGTTKPLFALFVIVFGPILVLRKPAWAEVSSGRMTS